MRFPRMLRIRQIFDAPRVNDVTAATRETLQKLRLDHVIKPGQTVAVTVGSRGIANIAAITKAIVGYLQGLGAKPFIVPAMGSHGGGTADGQRAIVESYGVTESYVGCEIRSSMETAIVDRTPQGIPVHFDKNALSADHVLVCGRVKPHTGFVGEVESGLHKMMLIGLGKHDGARIYHRAIADYSFEEIVRAVGESVLRKCKVCAGLAIVENANDETALIEGVSPNEFYAREKELLILARKWLPRLPFRETDLLIVDEIGKDISGTGMDTNVVGRKFNDHAATDRDEVKCRRIFVRGLTLGTKGNATGIGMAEFTNRRTVEAIDRKITVINCVTGNHVTAAMTPVYFDSDREVLETAMQTIGLREPHEARVVQIPNTLQLTEVLVSENYLPQIKERQDLVVTSEPTEMGFDGEGNLPLVRGKRHSH